MGVKLKVFTKCVALLLAVDFLSQQSIKTNKWHHFVLITWYQQKLKIIDSAKYCSLIFV